MTTRRQFLKGSCATAAATALGGPALLFSSAATAAASGHDTVVHLFLRGGLDGLNLVVPVSGADRGFYEQARPQLAIAASGAYGALPLTLASGAATGFGLHPSAAGLRDLWNAGHLAIVHACGLLTSVTRSHFDAQLYVDLGTPGQQSIGSGWMTRAMNLQAGIDGSEQMPALGMGARQPAGLLASTQALALASPSDFALNAGAWAWQTVRSDSPAGFAGVNETLASLWGGQSALELGGQRADRALRVIARQAYSAPPSGWPTGAFAQQLWTIAQSIQFELGLHYATLDLGGWDTHNGQGTAGAGYHYYQNKIAELSQGLAAFYAALDASGHAGRVTVVVQSEFGRRVRANASGGTDHGYGNPVLVLGGPVNGRRFYGSWSGLDPEILSPHFGDVPVTTDHRRVLWEILAKRMGQTQVAGVFPGYSGYAPLGVVRAAGSAALRPAPERRRLTAPMPAPADAAEPDVIERMLRYVQALVD